MNTMQNQKNTASTIGRISLITISLLVSLLMAGPATAASACKGLENSACDNKASCGWVEGYQRKDGRAVKSFCRAKPLTKTSVSKKLAVKSESSVASK